MRCHIIVLTVCLAGASAQAEVRFRKHVIDPAFQAEACAVADVDGDGRLDLVAGENWYRAPDWRPRQFRTVARWDGYADVRCDHPVDLNGDGRMDLVTVHRGPAMAWLENPSDHQGHWRAYPIGESTMTEGVVAGDLDGDGLIDLIGPTGEKAQAVAWWKAPADRTQPWIKTIVGSRGGGLHGIGLGDLNRDGRPDVLVQQGWYEAPADPRQGEWPFHELDRGDTHHPVVYDFDGDGDQDVAASSPHDYGLYWWEQSTGEDGRPAWTRHTIDESISQLHTLVGADIDGDGDTDLLTGKRYRAHDDRDPGSDEPSLLVWYELRRDGERATFTRHVIDDDSGVGYMVTPADVDGDGDTDLLTGKRYRAHDDRDPGSDEPSLLVWYELRRDGERATFTRHVIDDDSGVGYMVTPADVDGDGDIDVLTANKKGVFLLEQEGRPTLLPLFDGRTLDNWIGDKTLWRVEDGAIVGRTETGIEHNSFLVSKDHYADFVLTLEVKLVPDTANSGIQFRSVPRENGEVEGYQADIARGWWGSIYEELARGVLHDGYKGRGEKAVVPEQWNQYVVYAVGEELRVEINGTVCTAIRDDRRSTGVIALQVHSGGPTEVRFRNIRLKRCQEPFRAGMFFQGVPLGCTPPKKVPDTFLAASR